MGELIHIIPVRVGGVSHEKLITRAEQSERKIKLTNWARTILDLRPHLTKRTLIEVVAIRLRLDLPVKVPLIKVTDKVTGEIKEKKDLSARPMLEEALANGLCLCPVSLGLEILLQQPRGTVGEAYLAMNSVHCPCEGSDTGQDNILSIFDKEGEMTEERILSATPANLTAGGFADGGMAYLFCRRTDDLIKAGLGRLAA